jgi:hypothetical protein
MSRPSSDTGHDCDLQHKLTAPPVGTRVFTAENGVAHILVPPLQAAGPNDAAQPPAEQHVAKTCVGDRDMRGGS